MFNFVGVPQRLLNRMKPLVDLCLLHMTNRITGPGREDGGDGGADGEDDAVALDYLLAKEPHDS